MLRDNPAASTPTQAQIEAALNAYASVIDVALPQRSREKAMIAALIAAAQVGEQDWELKWKCREMALVALSEAAIAATIERCAQVVENLVTNEEDNRFEHGQNIAAEIRKLKDET